MIENLFKVHLSRVKSNLYFIKDESEYCHQQQTNQVFSEKWDKCNENKDKEALFQNQKDWYLDLYGFKSEEHLKSFLSSKEVIFDAGCGLGGKTSWFAELAPESLVIGMDFSDSISIAADNYKHLDNLLFIKGDIADTGLKNDAIDFVNCDQVIMHTEDPDSTFSELVRITKSDGEFACYVYARKALPRELLDTYFREKCLDLNNDQLWSLSEQLTELGKNLSELDVKINVPDIPLLSIKGGEYDVQRFIYWNFLKCFWNPDLGEETSTAINFDWYSPSNARRFSREEFIELIENNQMHILTFHEENACYSGRFGKTKS